MLMNRLHLIKKSEDIKERSYLHSHIQERAVSIEIDHAAVEPLDQKIEM